MKHEKTFAAIDNLKDVELELHRLKNALEIANRALDAQRPWVGLTDDEASWCQAPSTIQTWKRIETKLKEKNT